MSLTPGLTHVGHRCPSSIASPPSTDPPPARDRAGTAVHPAIPAWMRPSLPANFGSIKRSASQIQSKANQSKPERSRAEQSRATQEQRVHQSTTATNQNRSKAQQNKSKQIKTSQTKSRKSTQRKAKCTAMGCTDARHRKKEKKNTHTQTYQYMAKMNNCDGATHSPSTSYYDITIVPSVFIASLIPCNRVSEASHGLKGSSHAPPRGSCLPSSIFIAH